MSGTNDVQDILGDGRPDQTSSAMPSKDAILSASKKKSKKPSERAHKRPEGMSREVYALLCSDHSVPPPLMASDTSDGYKANKAMLGRASVRKYSWMPFKNPARKDGLVLNHWRRSEDVDKEYPFVRFNKSLDIVTYTNEEYERYLAEDQQSEPAWSREETDHLFDLCRRFDLRFIVIHDRFDREKFQQRSVEDIKERYYDVCNKIAAARSPSTETAPLVCAYDAQHETLRKQQLEKLFARTPEEVQDEVYLLAELKKIDAHRKDRERKAAADNKLLVTAEASERKADKKKSKRKGSHAEATKPGKSQSLPAEASSGGGVFKPFDRASGVSLRSAKIKSYPNSFPQRRSKVIDAVLDDLGVGISPIATEKVCVAFNALRNQIQLLLDLKKVADNFDYDMQTLKHQYHAQLQSAKKDAGDPDLLQELAKIHTNSSTLQLIDVVNGAQAGTAVRKRRTTSSLDAATLLKRRKA